MGTPDENDGMIDATHPLLAEVQRQIDDEIDLAALAERFGYSPFHFHRLFTRAVGETPKAHIARLRLEKSFLLVAVTGANFLDIALTVGFQNHETFTRAFKRQFGMTPRKLRADARHVDRRPAGPSGNDFRLSPVRYVTLPAKHMLALRKLGSYTEPFPPPYQEGDTSWSTLATWAEAHGVRHSRLAWGFFLDMPGITPPETMRSDFCIEIEHEVSGDGRIFHFPFPGGIFGVIEHRGPYATLPLAYRQLVNAIISGGSKYVLNGAPPFQIHREVHIGGDPDANVTEVYFPVSRTR
jgi:AraC family transcriptional regulator